MKHKRLPLICFLVLVLGSKTLAQESFYDYSVNKPPPPPEEYKDLMTHEYSGRNEYEELVFEKIWEPWGHILIIHY